MELFCHYPPQIVERAISPVFGLPSKFKFPPRIPEIKEFLEDSMPKETHRVYPLFPKDEPEKRISRPTYEELQAKCAEAGLIIGKQNKREAIAKEIKDFRDKFNIDDAQWKAIPNAR